MKICSQCSETKPEGDFYKGRPECKTCTKARQKLYRDGIVPVIPERKVCPRCRIDKPEGEYHRNANRPDGLLAYCKLCWSEMERLRKYGITREEFDRLMLEQEGACAICTDPFVQSPHVDHDHQTGAVRGLLCDYCNHGLGKFRDSARNLRRAIDYLSR